MQQQQAQGATPPAQAADGGALSSAAGARLLFHPVAPPFAIQDGLGKAIPPAAHPEEWAPGKVAPPPATAVVAATGPGSTATAPVLPAQAALLSVLPPSPFSSEATGTLPPFKQEAEATPAKPSAPPVDKPAVDLLVVGVSAAAAAAAAAAFEAQQECVTEGGERAYGVQLGDNIVPHGRPVSFFWQGISPLGLVCKCTMYIVNVMQPCLQLPPLIPHVAAKWYTPPLHAGEEERLRALRMLGVLQQPVGHQFGSITRSLEKIVGLHVGGLVGPGAACSALQFFAVCASTALHLNVLPVLLHPSRDP